MNSSTAAGAAKNDERRRYPLENQSEGSQYQRMALTDLANFASRWVTESPLSHLPRTLPLPTPRRSLHEIIAEALQLCEGDFDELEEDDLVFSRNHSSSGSSSQ
eukprot:scaffold6781_cov204-Amphora_coffeaeformis.AAC.16